MKKVSIVAAKQSRRISEQKLTVGLDLGDRSSWYCVLDEFGAVVLEQRLKWRSSRASVPMIAPDMDGALLVLCRAPAANRQGTPCDAGSRWGEAATFLSATLSVASTYRCSTGRIPTRSSAWCSWMLAGGVFVVGDPQDVAVVACTQVELVTEAEDGGRGGNRRHFASNAM